MKRRVDNSELPVCHKCGHKQNVKLRYQITVNDQCQFFWYCTSCKCRTPDGAFLPKGLINKFKMPEKFWTVGLLKDNRHDVACVVCGKKGAELHHFAPQSLKEYFGENWCKWPTAYLCVMCHRLWHSAVTPHMPGYRNTAIAREVVDKEKK